MNIKLINIYLTLISVSIMLGGSSCKTDSNDIKSIKISFYYHSISDVENIKEFLNKLVEPFQCDKNVYNRYDVTIQYIKSSRPDTIISRPNFKETVNKDNINRHWNYSKKALKDFKITSNYNLDTISTNNFDSIYFEITKTVNNLSYYISNSDSRASFDSIKLFSDEDSLVIFINSLSCKNGKDFAIIWNPQASGKKDTVAGIDHKGTSIIEVPTDINIQNRRYNELIANSRGANLSWSEWYEIAILSAKLGKNVNVVWDYLNTAGKSAIDEGESSKLLNDLSLDIVHREFQRVKKESIGKWNALLNGLEREDKSIIGINLGISDRVNANGCISANLLVPFTEASVSNFNPQFKLTTNSLNRFGGVVFNLDILYEDRFEWDSKTNISLASGGNVTLEFLKAKMKVTIENNTIPGATFSTMCFRFAELMVKDDNKGKQNETIEMRYDGNFDNDGDGFIGCLDINDTDSNKYPKLEFEETYLNDRFDFKLGNGENLTDVEYKWYINSLPVSVPYQFNDIGCYNIKVKLTHLPTGKYKEISEDLHVKLPLYDLERDLKAILLVGSYTAPAKPPTNEVRKADEAEARILNYFASGCEHTVINQFKEKKSIDELLNADLKGARGKIYSIKVKSISYKNNGCNKICSFLYEIGQ